MCMNQGNDRATKFVGIKPTGLSFEVQYRVDLVVVSAINDALESSTAHEN